MGASAAVRVRSGACTVPQRSRARRRTVSDRLPRGWRPTQTGRLAGLAVARDGSLLVGDDENGVLYRVSHDGGRGVAVPSDPPATAMRRQTSQGSGVPLALKRVEAHNRLSVWSDAFASGDAVPSRYSEYRDGVAPPLAWDPVEGAVTYVILVEDPDAASSKPFVHWVAWNLTEATTPEGLEESIRLPSGLTRGRSSCGSVGWLGPRPPVNHPAHHYQGYSRLESRPVVAWVWLAPASIAPPTQALPSSAEGGRWAVPRLRALTWENANLPPAPYLQSTSIQGAGGRSVRDRF